MDRTQVQLCAEQRFGRKQRHRDKGGDRRPKPYVHLKANCQKWGFVPQSSHSAHTITLQSQGKIPSRSNLPYAKQTRSNYSILPCIIIIHNAYRPSICSYQHSRCISQLLSYVCKTSSITSVAILGVSKIIFGNRGPKVPELPGKSDLPP